VGLKNPIRGTSSIGEKKGGPGRIQVEVEGAKISSSGKTSWDRVGWNDRQVRGRSWEKEENRVPRARNPSLSDLLQLANNRTKTAGL